MSSPTEGKKLRSGRVVGQALKPAPISLPADDSKPIAVSPLSTASGTQPYSPWVSPPRRAPVAPPSTPADAVGVCAAAAYTGPPKCGTCGAFLIMEQCPTQFVSAMMYSFGLPAVRATVESVARSHNKLY